MPMKDYCFVLNEQKRLKRLSTVKSAISSIAKHDTWTKKQVEKRASEILHQKRVTQINQSKSVAKEGIKVLTGNRSTVRSELTRCGLRLRLSLGETDFIGSNEVSPRRRMSECLSNNISALMKSCAKVINKNEFSKQHKLLQKSCDGAQYFNSKLPQGLQQQRKEVILLQDFNEKNKIKQKAAIPTPEQRIEKITKIRSGLLFDSSHGPGQAYSSISNRPLLTSSCKSHETATGIKTIENLSDQHAAKDDGGDSFSSDNSVVALALDCVKNALPAVSSLDEYSSDEDFSLE